PSAFSQAGIVSLRRSSSEAGTKSFQRSQWTVAAWAYAGARPVARIAARPPEAFRTVRREIRRRALRTIGCSSLRVLVAAPLPFDRPRGSGVDLHELVMRPFDGVLRRHPLHRLRVHVDDEVLGDDLGGLPGRGTGVAGEATGPSR